MSQKKLLKTGDKAPDFSLMDQNKKEFKLSDFIGKRVLLSFHPLAWTAVCAKQMQSLERYQNDFKKLNTVAVGINIDSVPSKNEWAKSLGIKNTRLLSDIWPHGKIAELYGIFRNQDGISERANIIIDEKQKIIFFKIYELTDLPDINEIIEFLRKN